MILPEKWNGNISLTRKKEHYKIYNNENRICSRIFLWMMVSLKLGIEFHWLHLKELYHSFILKVQPLQYARH